MFLGAIIVDLIASNRHLKAIGIALALIDRRENTS